MTATGYGLHGTWRAGTVARMLLRRLASLRADISVGPSFVGRYAGRWMLDTFLPGRGGYISPAIPRYPMMPEAVPLSGTAAELALARACRRTGVCPVPGSPEPGPAGAEFAAEVFRRWGVTPRGYCARLHSLR